MCTVSASARGVTAGHAALGLSLALLAATSGGGGRSKELRSQEGRLRRLYPGQHVAQSLKYLRPGFEEKTEKLGGPAT